MESSPSSSTPLGSPRLLGKSPSNSIAMPSGIPPDSVSSFQTPRINPENWERDSQFSGLNVDRGTDSRSSHAVSAYLGIRAGGTPALPVPCLGRPRRVPSQPSVRRDDPEFGAPTGRDSTAGGAQPRASVAALGYRANVPRALKGSDTKGARPPWNLTPFFATARDSAPPARSRSNGRRWGGRAG